MRIWLLALAAPAAFAANAREVRPDPLVQFVQRTLQVSRYQRADADLNGDGRLESVIYVTDPDYCGSGGCTLFVLSPHGGSYRIVLRETVVRRPILLLSTVTRGWRDLGVTRWGGGVLQPYTARLRFSGHRYARDAFESPAATRRQLPDKVLVGP